MQVRKPSLRTHVTKLGLRCQNHDRMGKLSFPAHSTEHAMWMAVGAASKDSFAQVIQVVDSFGAQVWIDTNRDALLVADPRTPYTRDFHWPADREHILAIFKDIYADRQVNRAAALRYAAQEEKKPTKALVANVKQPASRPKTVVTPEHPKYVHDLMITWLWLMTPKGGYAASLRLGKLQTIRGLFGAIERAFDSKYKLDEPMFEGGSLLKIHLTFNNLGPKFEEERILCADSGDGELKELRWDIFDGYRKNRDEEDKEMVICWANAFFKHDINAFDVVPDW